MMGVLYAFTFLHGVFAAGVIPILGRFLPGHATPAFAAYFIGLVAGQLLVVAWAGLRARPRAYAVCEALFGASLVAMGALLEFVPWSLILGRLVEGIAAGMSLPLLFELVARHGGAAGVPRRLAIFNSLFVIGFVAGPPLVEALLARTGAASILVVAGGLCALLAAAALPFLQVAPPPTLAAPAAASWFGTFFLIFLAKCAYGFVLPFTTDHLAPRLAPLSLGQIMLLLSGASVAGQVAAVLLTRRGVPTVTFPSVLATVLLLLYATGAAWLMFPAGVVHSLVLHAGLVAAAARPGGARDFALVNSLSDPGMVLGAALAATGEIGILGIAALCLVPLAQRALRAAPT